MQVDLLSVGCGLICSNSGKVSQCPVNCIVPVVLYVLDTAAVASCIRY